MLWDWFNYVNVTNALDIAFMSLFIYALLIWFQRTRAAFILIGIVILGGVYLFARQFDLSMTTAVFQSFFTVILIAGIIIFQEELRYFFERIAVWSLHPGLSGKKIFGIRPAAGNEEAAVLSRTLFHFAREKTGSLVVLRGRDFLLRHLEGGIELNGRISEALLKSLFAPHSAGHDGAVIIEGGDINRFSSHLPLSKNLASLSEFGTRHAAALGLSEKTDALCLAVSEEKGTVSVARRGAIQTVNNEEELKSLLENFYREIDPDIEAKRPWEVFFKRNNREKVIAVAAAFLLWFVLVHGSTVTYRTYDIPVEHHRLPRGLKVSEIRPPEVQVTFSGPQRNFYLTAAQQMRLRLNASGWNEGVNHARLSFNDFSFPEGISIRHIHPSSVEAEVK